VIGNILKIVIALILGYLFGLVFGAISGALLGAIPGLFFREIILFKQSILMSITLVLILGGLLGLFASKLVNKFLDVNDNPFISMMFGLLVGILVIVFKVGVIGISDLDTSDQRIYLVPIFYGEIAGSAIGSIIFSIIGAIGVVRVIIKDDNDAKNNKQRLEEIKKSLGMNAPEEKSG
jgi:hypothetical protein